MALPTDTAYFLEEFTKISRQYLSDINYKPVAQLDIPQIPLSFGEQPRSNEHAVEQMMESVLPYLSTSAGARYWGFVTGGANPAALFADWLVSTFDQNVSKDGGSIASAVERQALAWLKSLFYLPETFDGIITTGATSANFLWAIFARQFAGQQQGINVAQQGMQGLSVEVFSASPHASMTKSLGLAGFGQQQITTVATLPDSEEMDINHLASLLNKSSAKSKMVIASSGTVTATSFDDLTKVSLLCQQHDAWLHVDAAFGIFERLFNQTEGKTKGIELADSITVDFHKWLNVPYDAGAIFTRHQEIQVQSCHVNAPYLTNDNEHPAFLSLGVENSRRFRALPIWFTLLKYGREGIKAWVERNIALAQALACWIKDQPNFELSIECQLNVVVFRPILPHLDDRQVDAFTRSFLQTVNQEGTVFMSAGNWQGKQVIRAAICNWQTSEDDLALVKASLLTSLEQVTNN